MLSKGISRIFDLRIYEVRRLAPFQIPAQIQFSFAWFIFNIASDQNIQIPLPNNCRFFDFSAGIKFLDDVGSVSFLFQVLGISFVRVNLLDFVVGKFLSGKEVNFFHLDKACRDTVFPLADWTLKDNFVGATASDNEGAFSADLVV